MKRLVLASLIFAGIAFAVSSTKFYSDINMQNHKVTNLAAPTAVADAVNKAYTDTADALKLPYSGGTMSGTITMGSSYSPNAGKDVATKEYVDQKVMASNEHDVFAFYKTSGQYANVFSVSETGGMVRAVMLYDNINNTINLEASREGCQLSVKRTSTTTSAGSDFGIWFKPPVNSSDLCTTIKVSNGRGDYDRFLVTYTRTVTPDWDIWVKGGSMAPTRIDTAGGYDASGIVSSGTLIFEVGLSNKTASAISSASFSVSGNTQIGGSSLSFSYPTGSSGYSIPSHGIVWKAVYCSPYDETKGAALSIMSACVGATDPKTNGTLYVPPSE